MALTGFQQEILRLLARNRSPESFFGGGATLNRHRARFSEDFDIEHDDSETVERSFLLDREVLLRSGYGVETGGRARQSLGFIEATVTGSHGSTMIDWTYDSAVRFFPVLPDDEFGWRLHDVDLAVNKVLAMAGRREPRDYHDVVTIHESGPPLAALAWAACGKDPGLAPELILDELTRHSRYPAEELNARIRTDRPVDPVQLKLTLLAAVADARDLFPSLPATQAGCLYLAQEGQVVRPDPAGVEEGRVVLHPVKIGGAWPVVSKALPP